MALAKALLGMGRKVTFLCPAFHAEVLQRDGIPYVPLGTVESFLEKLNDPDLWHPRKAFRTLMEGYGEALQACIRAIDSSPIDERCVFLAHPLALPALDMVRSRRHDTQIVSVYLAPSNLRSCQDPLTIGPLPIAWWVPMACRRFLWRCIDRHVINPPAVPQVNAARRSAGLPPH
jgi:rhamnosyltransferase subunit B